MNLIFLFGAVLGLTSVMMAAYVDHSLGLYLTGKALTALKTAVRYHQLYAVVVCMIGLSQQNNGRVKSWLVNATSSFLVGVLLFSGSIYLSAVTGATGFLTMTPIGGVMLMVGWGCLIRSALLRTR